MPDRPRHTPVRKVRASRVPEHESTSTVADETPSSALAGWCRQESGPSLYVMEDGASAEIAIVGNEGILGISLFMGGDTTPSRAVVQSAGHGFRLRAELLKDEFGRFGPTMHLLLRYTQALITQMAQTAACNRHHSVDQQLCRWLLLSLDRLASNELSMTQELIANMLGVRREGVTEAAGKLQDAGLDSATAGAESPCWTARAWRRDRANATKWSRKRRSRMNPGGIARRTRGAPAPS